MRFVYWTEQKAFCHEKLQKASTQTHACEPGPTVNPPQNVVALRALPPEVATPDHLLGGALAAKAPRYQNLLGGGLPPNGGPRVALDRWRWSCAWTRIPVRKVGGKKAFLVLVRFMLLVQTSYRGNLLAYCILNYCFKSMKNESVRLV